eukprot:366362-Chlamydomonas_euryale.AAC.8
MATLPIASGSTCLKRCMERSSPAVGAQLSATKGTMHGMHVSLNWEVGVWAVVARPGMSRMSKCAQNVESVVCSRPLVFMACKV